MRSRRHGEPQLIAGRSLEAEKPPGVLGRVPLRPDVRRLLAVQGAVPEDVDSRTKGLAQRVTCVVGPGKDEVVRGRGPVDADPDRGRVLPYDVAGCGARFGHVDLGNDDGAGDGLDHVLVLGRVLGSGGRWVIGEVSACAEGLRLAAGDGLDMGIAGVGGWVVGETAVWGVGGIVPSELEGKGESRGGGGCGR